MRKIVPVIATIALTGMLVSCGAKAPVEQIPLTPKAQSVDTKAPETKAVSDTMLAPTPVDVAATGMMPSDGAYVNTSGTTVDMAGGVNINSNGSNVSVTSTGAIVNSDGTSVTANSDGSYINSDGTTVDTKEWMKVNAVGVTVSSEQTGELNTGVSSVQITNSGSGTATVVVPQTQANQAVSD